MGNQEGYHYGVICESIIMIPVRYQRIPYKYLQIGNSHGADWLISKTGMTVEVSEDKRKVRKSNTHQVK